MAKTPEEERPAALPEDPAEIREFMIMFFHDLKTPLNVVISAAEILREDLADPDWQVDREELQEFTGMILECANQLLDLLGDAQRVYGQGPEN